MVGMEKKVRFGDLVRNSGRPQTLTLWTKPEDNPALTRAIKQNRVLTVLQESGKKDHGLIGFKPLPGALYLEFPEALPPEPDARVIGINYALIDEPAVPRKERVNPTKPSPARARLEKPSPPRKETKPAIPKPRPHEFIIKVRRTASLEDEIRVKALDQPEAERRALERARHKPFKPGKAVRAEIVKTE